MFNELRSLDSVNRDAPDAGGRFREFLRDARSALIFGTIPAQFGAVLDALDIAATVLVDDELAADEARVFSTDVHVGPLDAETVRAIGGATAYDAVVVANALETASDPRALLRDLRGLLKPKGNFIGLFPNRSHGAIRLAMLKGLWGTQGGPGAGNRRYVMSEIEEVLLDAGYIVDAVERVRRPIFAQIDELPAISEIDFSQAVVAEVESDSESQTLQFLVKARQIDEATKARTVAQRFQRSGAELSSALSTLEKHRAEFMEVREALVRAERRLEALETNPASVEGAPLPKAISKVLAEVATTNTAILGAEIDALRLRASELERTIQERDADVAAAQQEAQAATQARAGAAAFERLLAEQRTTSSAELSQALTEWEASLQELDAARAELESFQRAHREALHHIEGLNAKLAAVESQREATAVEVRLSRKALHDARRESDALRSSSFALKAQIAQLERDVATWRSELDAAGQRAQDVAQLLADRDASYERLEFAYGDLEERYAEQTRGLIAEANEQTRELVNFTNAIQTGKFWRLKKIAAKIRRLLDA